MNHRHTTLGDVERRPYRYGLVEYVPEPRRWPWWTGFVAELLVFVLAVAGVVALMSVAS